VGTAIEGAGGLKVWLVAKETLDEGRGDGAYELAPAVAPLAGAGP
jgi:hypothetical protein